MTSFFYFVGSQVINSPTLAYFRPNNLAIIKYTPIFVV